MQEVLMFVKEGRRLVSGVQHPFYAWDYLRLLLVLGVRG